MAEASRNSARELGITDREVDEWEPVFLTLDDTENNLPLTPQSAVKMSLDQVVETLEDTTLEELEITMDSVREGAIETLELEVEPELAKILASFSWIDLKPEEQEMKKSDFLSLFGSPSESPLFLQVQRPQEKKLCLGVLRANGTGALIFSLLNVEGNLVQTDLSDQLNIIRFAELLEEDALAVETREVLAELLEKIRQEDGEIFRKEFSTRLTQPTFDEIEGLFIELETVCFRVCINEGIEGIIFLTGEEGDRQIKFQAEGRIEEPLNFNQLEHISLRFPEASYEEWVRIPQRIDTEPTQPLPVAQPSSLPQPHFATLSPSNSPEAEGEQDEAEDAVVGTTLERHTRVIGAGAVAQTLEEIKQGPPDQADPLPSPVVHEQGESGLEMSLVAEFRRPSIQELEAFMDTHQMDCFWACLNGVENGLLFRLPSCPGIRFKPEHGEERRILPSGIDIMILNGATPEDRRCFEERVRQADTLSPDEEAQCPGNGKSGEDAQNNSAKARERFFLGGKFEPALMVFLDEQEGGASVTIDNGQIFIAIRRNNGLQCFQRDQEFYVPLNRVIKFSPLDAQERLYLKKMGRS